MSGLYFRAGVVIVVRHPDLEHVMAFERADNRGSWQLPQGGMNDGETPIVAAWRELLEETALGPEHVDVLAEFPDWVAYEWPPEARRAKATRRDKLGQVQRWFLFHALRPDIVPRPDGSEFVAWKWVTPVWLIDHVPPFRHDAYARVLGTL
ncbi:MAG: NUDIX domain-containing protein [Ilumatobacteraceae bacterium]